MANTTKAKTTKPAAASGARKTKAKVPAPAKKTASSVRESIAEAVKSGVKAAPKPKVVSDKSPTLTDPALKKKELIDAVVERSGIKKKFAKPVVEAMLGVLGDTLGKSREMNLQPLGKVKINRSKEVQGGTVLIAKVRQSSRVIQEKPKTPVKKTS